MRVLVACEYSGIVRDAFTKQGCYAMSCDLLPSEKPGEHYQGDVMDVLGDGWDLMIAHPPCTYLANSGSSQLHKPDYSRARPRQEPVLTGQPRWDALDKGCEFFKALLECDIPHKVVENSVPHKYAIERIGRTYDQLVHPYHFGHMERKGTALWFDNVRRLQYTNNVWAIMRLRKHSDQHKRGNLSPSENRWKERSRTYQGLANAMAAQYCRLVP